MVNNEIVVEKRRSRIPWVAFDSLSVKAFWRGAVIKRHTLNPFSLSLLSAEQGPTMSWIFWMFRNKTFVLCFNELERDSKICYLIYNEHFLVLDVILQRLMMLVKFSLMKFKFRMSWVCCKVFSDAFCSLVIMKKAKLEMEQAILDQVWASTLLSRHINYQHTPDWNRNHFLEHS